MVSYTPKQIADGRVYLAEILPKAKEELATHPDMRGVANSALAKAAAPYYSESNMGFLIIHQVTTGWNVDLVFKKMPPGVSDVIGTPSDLPHRTREEAEEHALDLVAYALDLYRQHEGNPNKYPPAFALFNIPIDLTPAIYDAMIAELPEGFPIRAISYGSTERAFDRIEEVLEEFLPGIKRNPKLLSRRFNKLPKDDKIRIMSVLHIAALSGVTRYPPIPVRTATGHQASRTKQ